MQYGEKCMDGEIKGVSVGNHSCLLLRKASHRRVCSSVSAPRYGHQGIMHGKSGFYCKIPAFHRSILPFSVLCPDLNRRNTRNCEKF